MVQYIYRSKCILDEHTGSGGFLMKKENGKVMAIQREKEREGAVVGQLFIDNSQQQLSLCSWRWSLLSWSVGLTRAWRKTRFSRISSFPPDLFHTAQPHACSPLASQVFLHQKASIETTATRSTANSDTTHSDAEQHRLKRAKLRPTRQQEKQHQGPPLLPLPRVKGVADVLRREKVPSQNSSRYVRSG